MPSSDDDTAARAQRARATCPFLTTQQTAFHLGLAARSLKRMRAEGRGPVCRLHGRAWYYHIDDIEAWSNAHKRGGDHD
jgi:hypothetical protein